MGVFWETVPESQFKWIRDQKMFWVATGPLSGSGHINVSPKGGAYFDILDPVTFWYMDLTGSGNETISHLHEPGNGRITIMFNAFDGPPKIIRLWGKGRVLENGTKEFDDFIQTHSVKTIPGSRSIIIVDIHQVGSSCGFSVPYYDFKDFRPILNDFFEKKKEKFDAGNEKESIDRYWAYKNAWSMDNLPGMKRALVAGKRENVEPIKKMIGPLAPPKFKQYSSSNITFERLILVAFLSFILGIVIATYGPELSETFNLNKSQQRPLAIFDSIPWKK